MLCHDPNALKVLGQLHDLAILEGDILTVLDNVGVRPVQLVPLARHVIATTRTLTINQTNVTHRTMATDTLLRL